jgi:hypothetical protein
MGLSRTIRAFCRWYLRVAVGTAICFLSCEMLAQQSHIVIVNNDDMGWGDFHSYGSAYSQTPNIDALASHGKQRSSRGFLFAALLGSRLMPTENDVRFTRLVTQVVIRFIVLPGI